jgi:hypothetical protein
MHCRIILKLILNALWHTTNAICCFSAKKLITQARFFTKLNFLLIYELQQLTISQMSLLVYKHRHVPVCIKNCIHGIANNALNKGRNSQTYYNTKEKCKNT